MKYYFIILVTLTWEWIDNNGLTGGKFTDKATGNAIFLPAAGYLGVDGALYDAGGNGFYWSSTVKDAYGAYGLYFTIDGIYYWYSNDIYSAGLSVRSVAE